MCYQVVFIYALVAQLDRVSDSDSEGRWFESSRAHQRKAISFTNDFAEPQKEAIALG